MEEKTERASQDVGSKSDLPRKEQSLESAESESPQRIPDEKADTEYPTTWRLVLIMLALNLSVFLMALDNTIISTVIPKITDEFNSVGDVGWYGSAYLLTTSALQLLFGKIYSFWSVKWVFLTTVAIFELGSLLCGVAPNSATLIVGRAIAGIGSAGLFAGALLILSYNVPLAKRPAYIGLIGGMYGVAAVAGPLLGGALADRVTWRWCFYINLPIGGVAALMTLLFFPNRKPDSSNDKPLTLLGRIKHCDPLGTMLFLPAIICLLLALQWGGTTYTWNSGRIIALFVVFGVLILAFVYVQIRQGDNATVPLRIISNRSIWAGSYYGFCGSAGFFIMVYYIPLWFQVVQGTSAVESGVRNLPMMVSTIVMSIIVGGMVTKLGYYTPFMIAATVLMSIGAGLLSTFTPKISRARWVGYQILYAVGYGMGSRQPLVAVQAVLDGQDLATGIAVIIFFQTMGGAVFVSIGESVFEAQLLSSLAESVPSIDPQMILSVGATDLKHIIPANILPDVLSAYNNALTKAFLVGTAMAAASILGSTLMPWKSILEKSREQQENSPKEPVSSAPSDGIK